MKASLTILDKGDIWQWHTDHTSIFIVTTVMHTYASMGAINESILKSRAGDIVKDNPTTTLAKICTIPYNGICVHINFIVIQAYYP